MAESPSTPVVSTPSKGEVQDPSPLVIQMVQREIAQQHQLYEAKLQGLRAEIITTLERMDKALTKVEQYPTAVDTAIARVREYFDEKFRGVEMRFNERDKRFDIRETSNRELLQEQRTSAADAIRKAEDSMRGQLASVASRTDDLKERLIEVESRGKGANQLWALIVGGIGLFGVIVVLFFTLAQVTQERPRDYTRPPAAQTGNDVTRQP